ncbi:MAG: hypothetical protein WC476_01710, partial [Phycisphaerae bacterium]
LVAKQAIIDRALDKETQKGMPEQIVIPMPEPETVNISRKQVEKESETITSEQAKLIHAGIQAIAGMCDYARDLDGVGFNKFDANIGHSLAGFDQLTPKQAVLAKKLCRKYQRQIPEIWQAIKEVD